MVQINKRHGMTSWHLEPLDKHFLERVFTATQYRFRLESLSKKTFIVIFGMQNKSLRHEINCIFNKK